LSTLWAGVWTFVATPPADMLSLTAVAAIAVLAVLAAGALLRAAALGDGAAAPVTVRPAAIGAAHGVPRLRDPDAAGRPRPRAPSAGPAA
jgi:hypothetical protein